MSNLDKEEQELLDSVEQGEWKAVKNLPKELSRYQQYAETSLRKDKRINIRLSSNDLEALQFIAVEEGIPYQTLISSVLHKFVTGRFVERADKG
jgi:predicted DNA binding CopG/RHH family protein